jgi:septal ring factor EnvC (AmiA/AmiB activator)
MKRFFVFSKTITLNSLLCAALFFAGHAYADEKAEMVKLQKEIEALQKELKQVQGTRSDLQKNLEKSETQINELQKKASDINKQLNEQNKELDKLKNERSQLEQARKNQQTQIAEQMRAAHKLGEQSEVKVLLNQESPDQLSRIMKYHSYFMEAHTAKMQTYLDTITRIDALTPEIEKKTLELGVMQTELDAQRAQLKTIHGERQQALAKVNSQLKNKSQELKQLSEDRRRLQALLERVAKSVATTGAFTQGRRKILAAQRPLALANPRQHDPSFRQCTDCRADELERCLYLCSYGQFRYCGSSWPRGVC